MNLNLEGEDNVTRNYFRRNGTNSSQFLKRNRNTLTENT